MIELVVVMILVAILGAVASARYFKRTGFDAASYTEQVRAMARYAQKLAIAQNRFVYVEGDLNGVALCYKHAMPCPLDSQVQAPAGDNSGSAATRAYCSVGGTYSPHWYCEGIPAGVTMGIGSGGTNMSLSPFLFNGLGKPYLPTDVPANMPDNTLLTDSTFKGISMTVSADGSTATLSVAAETGYVN